MSKRRKKNKDFDNGSTEPPSPAQAQHELKLLHAMRKELLQFGIFGANAVFRRVIQTLDENISQRAAAARDRTDEPATSPTTNTTTDIEDSVDRSAFHHCNGRPFPLEYA